MSGPRGAVACQASAGARMDETKNIDVIAEFAQDLYIVLTYYVTMPWVT